MLQDSFLGDLVNEISMQTAATEATYAAAQATAAQLLQVSKDQYIRLNADFDNFRRRTVRYQAALFKHDIHSFQSQCCKLTVLNMLCPAKLRHLEHQVGMDT